MQPRWPVLLRGLLAAVLLAVLVAGIPVLLIQEVGWPLPTTVPAWDQVAQTISTGAIEDATIIKSLAVLVWLSWANLLAGVLVEVVALVRGRAALRVTGLRAAQHLAANLLATASIALATLSRPVTAPTADPGQLRLAVATALTEQPPDLVDLPGQGLALAGAGINGTALPSAGGSSSPSDVDTGRVYEVQRGDTLWDLAERFLGDGLRWREIRDANFGRVQPDGARIDTETEDLRPGWSLLLPARAHPSTSHATPAAALEEQGSVTVEPGDTLWGLADEHLDDPYRWPEVYNENRGDLQADGRALTDPDLIHPGWVLDLPVSTAESTVTAPPVDVESGGSVEVEAPSSEHVAQADLAPGDGRDRDTGIQDREEVDDQLVGEPPSVAAEERRPGNQPSAHEHAPSTGEADEADEDGIAAAIPVAAVASLAAGLILTLDRIRRARLRRREPGRRIPTPTGEGQQTEQRLRALADPDEARFVDEALRGLASHYGVHRPLPPIVMVSYGSEDLAVHLETPYAAAPDGWERDDDDLVWNRARPGNAEEQGDWVGTPSRLAALVTLGALSDDRVALLNLGHTACLHLEGHPAAARQLLGAWALELATTRRADALDVIAVGLRDLPSGLERLTVLTGPEELQDLLSRSHSNGQTNTPKTVILAADLPSDTGTLLRTTTEVRHDVVAAVLGLQPRSGDSVLRLGVTGSARLEPGGVDIRLLELTADAVPSAARLLEQALHDPDELVPIPELPEDDLEACLVEGPATDLGTEPEPAVEVRVLGPVEIVGVAQPFRTNKTIELIVYLALHRGGASMDTLMEALWPDQPPRAARLHTEASRARKALGVADDGSPLFPDAELGRYRLAPSVALDYERFASHVEASRREPRRATEYLRSALTLVRGVPLSSTATEYAWATNEMYRLGQEVVDAAHHLARLCHEAKRYDDAIWAAERGLTADPLAEVLVRDLIEAAVATGNAARAHAAMTRLRRHVAEIGDANDADDWLHPETVALFNSIPALSGRSATSSNGP